MRQTNNNGIRFIRPTQSAAEQPLLKCLTCGAMLFSLGALCGLDGVLLLSIVGVGICIARHFLGMEFWFYPGTLSILVIAAWMFRSTISDGFCQMFNIAGEIYTARTGMVISALEASADASSRLIFAGWLGALLGLCFSALCGWKLLPAAVVLLMTAASLLLERMADLLPVILAVMLLCGNGNWKTRVLPILTMAAMLLLFSLSEAESWAQYRSAQVSDAIHRHRYETKYTTLPEGELEPLRQSDAPALIVTMEKPEVLYLRGFTGAEFKDGRWQPMDNQILAEHQEILYWLNSREFDLRAQFEVAASILETRNNTVMVQNVGACSAYRYIPFTIRGDDRLEPGNLTDTAAGERYDSFTTVYCGAAMLPELLTALESESSRFLQAEAAYRQFVKSHYLSIPEDLAGKMQPYWENVEGMDAQAAVTTVLKTCYSDGIRHDPYYATAAVLTLRYFGIPARYAEGYITPKTMATTVELTGQHAACWAEVYHDGIGWIPMELTPGMDGQKMQQEEQPLPPDNPEQTLPPETEPTSEPEPDGGYQVRIAQALLSGAIMLMTVLLLLSLLLILRRRYILKKRQAILNQENIREAVTWSFADAVQILERMGIHRGNGSLDVLAQPLRDRFGAELAEQFESASRINAKAMFSSKSLTEPERKTVHGFRSSALTCLEANSGRLSGIWMKYILCII